MGRAASGHRAITCLLKGTTQTGYLLSSRVFSKLRAELYLVSTLQGCKWLIISAFVSRFGSAEALG